MFTVPSGAPVRRGNFNKVVSWQQAVKKIGAAGLHFHDQRHTGNTLAADAGVSTKNLMARMGHDRLIAGQLHENETGAYPRSG